MKNWLIKNKYVVWNSFFVIIFALVLDFAIASQMYGVNLEADVMLKYQLDGEEKLVEKYKDSEIFQNMISSRDKNIAEEENKLTEYKEGSTEYKETKNRIDYYNNYFLKDIIQQTIRIEEIQPRVRKNILIVDLSIFVIYVIICLISCKKKPVKRSKK